MTIWWVRADGGGSDGNTGLDYANAYATINKAYQTMNTSGTKGDMIYLVNDGTHEMPDAAVQQMNNGALTGTDYITDPGFVIKGVDSSGSPALTTVASPASPSGPGRFIYLRAGVRYVRVEGLFLDMSPADGTSGGSFLRFRDSTAGPILMRACRLRGYVDSDSNYGAAVRHIWEYDTTPPTDYGTVRYCVIENCSNPSAVTGSPHQMRLHNCVLWTRNKWANPPFPSWWIFTPADNASNVSEFYNNTMYIDSEDTAGSDIISALVSIGSSSGSGDMGLVNLHSNFIWFETSSPAFPTLVSQVFNGNGGATASNSGTIGYNVLQFGPSVAASEVADIYVDPWDDGVDPKATDNVAYEIADTALFNDPASTWIWRNVDGTTYDLTVPADLRPIVYRTAGLAGVTPGALPPAATDYSVTVNSSVSSPEPEENLALTITVSNSGADALDVDVTAAIPAGLSYVSDSPTAGTYTPGTGIWNVPVLDDGDTETLVLNVQVDADQAGNDITFTATWTSGDPSDDTNPANDSASTILSVVDTGDIGDPGGDGIIPYLDVFPIYGTVRKLTVNVWLKLKRNRALRHVLRQNIEGRGVRESSVRVFEVAPSSTKVVNIGGIQRGRYLILESTSSIVVKTGGYPLIESPELTFYFIGGGDIETIELVNNSSTVTATVVLGVTD